MLRLYDKNHNKVAGLTKYKDLCIESALSTGDKTLSFSYPKNLADIIEYEGYVRTKTAEFVVKEIDKKGIYVDVKCNLNLEDLEGQPWNRFNSTERTITDCLNLALAGTGWTIGTCTVTKKRTVRKTACNSLNIIQEAKKAYICEIEFDTINKQLNIAETLGSDKGVYFTEQLNLKELETQGNSYDFYTKINAYGKNDITVTLENYQYSNKVKALYWKDERYTDIGSLTEDATYKLNELSKPYIAYAATILDLANASDKYKDILAYSLGDTISLISKSNNVKEKQRIVKTTEYPDTPTKNTCELGNKTLRFEDIQKQQQDISDTVNNITNDNGTISKSAMNDTLTDYPTNDSLANTLTDYPTNDSLANTLTNYPTNSGLNNTLTNYPTNDQMEQKLAQYGDNLIQNGDFNEYWYNPDGHLLPELDTTLRIMDWMHVYTNPKYGGYYEIINEGIDGGSCVHFTGGKEYNFFQCVDLSDAGKYILIEGYVKIDSAYANMGLYYQFGANPYQATDPWGTHLQFGSMQNPNYIAPTSSKDGWYYYSKLLEIPDGYTGVQISVDGYSTSEYWADKISVKAVTNDYKPSQSDLAAHIVDNNKHVNWQTVTFTSALWTYGTTDGVSGQSYYIEIKHTLYSTNVNTGFVQNTDTGSRELCIIIVEDSQTIKLINDRAFNGSITIQKY